MLSIWNSSSNNNSKTMAERMVSLGRERPKKYREIEVLLFVLLYNIVQTKSTIHYYKIQQMEMMLQNSYLHHLSFLIFFFVKGTFIWSSWPSEKPFKHFDTISTYTFHIYWKKSWNQKILLFFTKKSDQSQNFRETNLLSIFRGGNPKEGIVVSTSQTRMYLGRIHTEPCGPASRFGQDPQM